MNKVLIGTVTGQDGNYFLVNSPEAPPHLKELNLVRSQLAGAVVGDRVRLEYQTTGSRSLWNVTKVLR